MPTRLTRRTLLAASGAAALAGIAGCARDEPAGAATDLSAPILTAVPPGTRLVIGDPTTQRALEFSGEVAGLPFEVEWANVSGGPQTLEAFRADALDIGAVADIPPIHATWTGVPVRIVAAKFRVDPIQHPIYQLGIAPGVSVPTLADLRGKRIAYSPGQAQGVLVLRALDAAGLTTQDVTLVELPSTGDVYPTALAAGEIDVAPIGGVNVPRYLASYGPDGATTLRHGLRDDPSHLYVRAVTLADQAKAAAIRAYVEAWARATIWVYENPTEWIDRYYVADQGLTVEDGQYLVDNAGEPDVPADWTDAIARHQQTIDLLVAETGNDPIDAQDLYDRRYEPGRPIPFGTAIGPVLLLAVWSLASATGWLDPRTLSEPWTVVATAADLVEDGRLQTHLLVSLRRAAIGLGLGVALGTVLALVSGLSRWGEAIVDGPIQIKRAVPALALIPLLILWWGIGEDMKIITITLGVFVPIYIHTHNGLRGIDSRYVELAESVGLRHAGFLRRVVLPGALPGFLLGMRFAVVAALLSLVVVEQVNTTTGIGYMMELARTYGQTDIIIVGLVLYGLLGLLADAAVRLAQKGLLSWRRTLAD